MLACTFHLAAQSYWQQEIAYKMDVKVNVDDYTFTGTSEIEYTNNSPDDLDRVYFHLYYNAFQPGSMMDIRSRTITDPDRRVGSRISMLKPNEIGKQTILDLKVDGKKVKYEIDGTILVVYLNSPIEAGDDVDIDLKFKAQVPVQIRRTGRNNKEGIEFSMSQWYPKMAEYDRYGWHTDPYIGREFHGVWGTFDVTLDLPAQYVVAASGYIQNAKEVGHGYSNKQAKGDRIKWHFVTPKVHDFMWAADKDYQHDTWRTKDGLLLRFFYKKNPKLEGDNQKEKFRSNWKSLQSETVKIFENMAKLVGKYPHKEYSVIQGGDGGMEYAMNTLITGHRPFKSLVEVTAHEIIHSWFQHNLATNESLYPWMDEGFTSYYEDEVMTRIFDDENIDVKNNNARKAYKILSNSKKEEPMTTHADHYETNFAYGRASYVKGSLFLLQLKHIIGQAAFDRTMKRYYKEWKFKHPDDEDFIRIAERESGYVLDWYIQNWIYTTKKVDYSILNVEAKSENTAQLTLYRREQMPLPQIVEVIYKDGKTKEFFIPLTIMRGEHKDHIKAGRTILKDWPWTNKAHRVMLEDIDVKNIHIIRLKTEWTGDVSDIPLDNDIYVVR